MVSIFESIDRKLIIEMKLHFETHYRHTNPMSRKSCHWDLQEKDEWKTSSQWLITLIAGNSIFMRSGEIASGPCEGGHVDELTFGLADDPNGCYGKGLTQVSPVYSTLRISGGKCQAECSGGVTTVYDPALINSSNEISFKNCDENWISLCYD